MRKGRRQAVDKWKKTIMHMGAYPAALGKWVLLGGIIGVLLPFAARRMGTDPATLSSPLIT